MIDKEKKKIINRRKSKPLKCFTESPARRVQICRAKNKKKKKSLPAIGTSIITRRPFQFAEVFVVPPSTIASITTTNQSIFGRPMGIHESMAVLGGERTRAPALLNVFLCSFILAKQYISELLRETFNHPLLSYVTKLSIF